MDATEPLPRRRCTSCRKWFDPSPSAVRTQRTCSPECRVKRRGMLARQRRERDIHEFRVAERARQKACRERRRAAGQTVTRREVSRATLPADVAGIREQVLALVDHEARRSRATLARQLRGILGATAAMLGQVEP